MPSKYKNNRHGRGGPGNDQNNNRNNNSGRNNRTTNSKKKTIEDYYFYVGSNKQASDYEIAAEYIINHIKKTYDGCNDIAETLRTLTKADIKSPD